MASFRANIIGTGLVSALGRGLPAHARALATGAMPASPQAPAKFLGQPVPFLFAAGSGPGDGGALLRMLEAAVGDALTEAALTPEQQARMGLFVGSTSLDLPLLESSYMKDYARGAKPLIQAPGYNTLAQAIARRFHIEGPQYTLSTACSSSANATLHARSMLAQGLIDHALVVGAEGYNALSLLGFAGLMLLTRAGYRPFDRARDGLVLGEGVGAMVLGKNGDAHQFRQPQPGLPAPVIEIGVRPYFSGGAIIGGATACDPTSPTGATASRVGDVLAEALDDAGLAEGDIVAVKAHGTGTPTNDQAEGQAVMQLFGGKPPPVTAIKPALGHTLGACGVIEVLCVLACWREGFLPPTPGFNETDPDIGLTPVRSGVPLGPGAVLCASTGFGGNNTGLVVAHP
ncbi:MAG TPA: beta-ketoacyl synthase N-terminal-like domain-containing protein [Verrucomicrobiae bacterium]|nr:beta-ketoacyl synthase N-terminal-like domain-containing protein [Verrucomicrobiae bacterium]